MEWIEVAKDLHAGTVGGIAGIVAGHPLDTIKVRLQTQTNTICNKMSCPLSCMRQITQSEGFKGLYRGMLSPILSNAPINAVVFAVYGQMTRIIKERQKTDSLSYGQQFIAGSTAGLFQTIFASPAELIKVRLQVDTKGSRSSSIEYGKNLYQKYGVTKGLYRGWTLTAFRDVPAFGIYFLTYDATKSVLTNGDPVNDTSLNLLLSGGIAGSLSWFLLHPVDVIKSSVQAASMKTPTTAYQVVKQRSAAEGPQFILKGLGTTVLRAFPVSAVTFLVYENVMAIL